MDKPEKTLQDDLRDAFDAVEREEAIRKETDKTTLEDAQVFDMHRKAIAMGQLQKKINRRIAAAQAKKAKNRKKNKAARKAKKRNRK